VLMICSALLSSCSGTNHTEIVIPANPGRIEQLAARELRRYIFLRSDELARIATADKPGSYRSSVFLTIDTALGNEEFTLQTRREGNTERLDISGGSPQALLYGAYEFAEWMGIRFYLHGDVIPDKKIRFSIPDLDIRRMPLFETRGILPFHDFPEGPDWWNEDDYKEVISQLPKLKMNFIGLHTYPWRTGFNGEGQKSEPLVWIGKEDQVNSDGTVKSAYPVLHFHTADSTWGYKPANTSSFLSGAWQLFETANYGAEYMKGLSPWPHTPEENIAIFNKSGRSFSSAFTLAKELGVKVCVGTESPLIVPQPELQRAGLKSITPGETKEYYRGTFSRIMKTYPIDYYWLWTPEGWTWSGVDDKLVAGTEADMKVAREALHELGDPFVLATCGWVLGPPRDRTEFDRILPKEMPFSCINRGLGYTPVDKGFAGISGRQKWSIPWMEDDPALLTAQLWAGRMRRDALDSRKYGCTGLMGIHWRTKIISPTISALAKAAWECDSYDQSAAGRDLPVDDFYSDWVKSEFGIAEPALEKIFTSLDGKGTEAGEGNKGDAMLNAADWIHGPGGLMTNKSIQDLEERIGRYGFLAEMESVRKKISGAGNLERFDYWLNVLKFNKAALETAKIQVELNSLADSIKKETSQPIRLDLARNAALPKRIGLAEKWEEMNRYLLAFASTTGEMGTIANLEMHNIRMNGNLTGHDEFLKSILGTDLPGKAAVSTKYQGKTRIVCTTNRGVLNKGEDLSFRVRVLSESDNISGTVFYRPLGSKKYSRVELTGAGSHVFDAKIKSALIPDDFEYYIEVSDGTGVVRYPATFDKINNSVIVL
jgi:hypothetical protein